MAGGFGTVFMPEMAVATFDGQAWSKGSLSPSDRMQIHPAAHVLHYASTCFEGLKAFRHDDGRAVVFRIDQNLARFAGSSESLCLPAIDVQLLQQMVLGLVQKYADQIPLPPGSFYIRPTHIGTEAAIGKAAGPSLTSMMYVLASPVGDYFSAGETALRLLVDDVHMRCAPDHGRVKGGGNYASALKHIAKARREHNADQVLFCPDGDVQETGAANFMMFDGNNLITKPLDESFLHGVTRNTVLQLAKDHGMNIIEKNFTVEEMLTHARQPGCEAALSGTAAVLASVGVLIHKGQEHLVGDGKPGGRVQKLRQALNDIQWGRAEDKHGWLTFIEGI